MKPELLARLTPEERKQYRRYLQAPLLSFRPEKRALESLASACADLEERDKRIDKYLEDLRFFRADLAKHDKIITLLGRIETDEKDIRPYIEKAPCACNSKIFKCPKCKLLLMIDLLKEICALAELVKEG